MFFFTLRRATVRMAIRNRIARQLNLPVGNYPTHVLDSAIRAHVGQRLENLLVRLTWPAVVLFSVLAWSMFVLSFYA